MAHVKSHYRRDHLELREGRWYAVLRVPRAAQGRLGRRRFRAALGTADVTGAKRLAMRRVVEWQDQIAQARGKRTEAPAVIPVNPTSYIERPGDLLGTGEHLGAWLASLDAKPKTLASRKLAVERLAKRFPVIADIDGPSVLHWLSDLRRTLTPASLQHHVGDCRIYWAYLQALGIVAPGASPFTLPRGTLKVRYASYQPYEPAEVAKLLAAATGDLRDLIHLAMYSGARREELCALKIESIKADRFEIVDAKTEAGVRAVPIHPAVKATLKRLTGKRSTGFLFEHLKTDANGRRSEVIGLHFTRLKRRLGFGERHAFHSLRGTVITMLERAGVPEGTTQDIVGHERSTLTGSTYSGKSTFEMRQAAIAKLRYPAK